MRGKHSDSIGVGTPVTGRPLHAVETLSDALPMVSFDRRRRCIGQVFRTVKTEGFDIEALGIGEPASRFKLVAAPPIAAMPIRRRVHARDGDPGRGPLRPITDVVEADDVALVELSAPNSKAGPSGRRTLTPAAPSPIWPGFVPGSAAGPALADNRVPSSCSQAGSDFNPMNAEHACRYACNDG